MLVIFKKELVYVALNQVFLSTSAVLIVVVLAHFTSQETFGEIRYLIAILTILSFWSLPGISLVLNQEASSLTRRELSSLIFTQFHWGLFALCGALIFAGFHTYRGDTALGEAFVVGAILTPIANLYLVPGLVLAGLKKFGLKVLCDTTIILTTLGGALLGVHLFTEPSLIMLSYFGAQSIATLAALSLTALLLPHKIKKRDRTLLLTHAEDGRTLTYLQIPFSLIPAIEKALVFLILGPVSLALFVIASLPVEHFKSAFRNLMQFYMLPHADEHDPSRLIHWFLIGALLLALGVAVLIVFILYGMPHLFENFVHAKHLALLLVLGALPLPIHVITILWIQRRTTINLVSYAGLAVLTNILFVGCGALIGSLPGAVVGKIVHELFVAMGLVAIDKSRRIGTATLSQ